MAAPHIPLSSDPPALVAAKADLREQLRAVRLAPATIEAVGALCWRLAEHVRAVLPRGAAVAAVWPLPGEVDLRGLCAGLHDDGYGVLLPETPPRGQALCFRRWSPQAEMRAGRFGTLYPDGAVARPDLVFVPLLGFDRRGFRLGYGGGYYDRTLAELPGVAAVGYGLAVQEVPAVPVGVYDVPLPVIMTEREEIRV